MSNWSPNWIHLAQHISCLDKNSHNPSEVNSINLHTLFLQGKKTNELNTYKYTLTKINNNNVLPEL